MKIHKIAFFALTAFAVAIAICSSGCKNSSADTSQSPVLATDSVRWEDSLSMKSCYARVEISGEYPVTGNLPLLDSVQAWLGNRLNTNVMNVGTPLFKLTPTLLASGNNIAAACGKALLNSAETDFKGFAADGITMDYEYIYNFGPEYVTDSIATYQFTGFGDMAALTEAHSPTGSRSTPTAASALPMPMSSGPTPAQNSPPASGRDSGNSISKMKPCPT